MGKYTGILIISDVDGTFFSKLSRPAFDKNAATVWKFKAQGGLFTFATGRDFPALLEVIPDAGEIANAPIIVCNGAQIYDAMGDKFIYDCPVSNKKLLREIIVRICEKYPEIGVRFSCEHNMIVPELNEMLRRDLHGYSLEKLRLTEKPLDELINSDIKIYKCVIADSDMPENLESVREILADADKNNEFYFAKSYLSGIEIVDRDGSKGQAALQLKKYTGARVLYAIGDYENDIEMLNAADFGAAPQSALEQVKCAAKIITVGCDDGAVADLIDIIGREITP